MQTKSHLLLFTLLILSSFVVPTGSCQDSLQENTSTNINLQNDGSATWSIENRFLLKTNDDIAIFQQYMQEFESKKQAYLSNFTDTTTTLVDRASVITGRSMRTENFQVSIDIIQTASVSYGVIIYQYDWVGFAKLEMNRLIIGDVFEGGFYLFQGDALTIKYPKEYGVIATAPIEDDGRDADQTLTWYGRRNFGSGEPTIILEQKTVVVIDATQWYLPLIIVSAVAAAILVGLYFLKFSKLKSGYNKNSLLYATLDKLEGDEDKVIRLLKSNGGKLYQSLIAKHCDFSSSKTSELLSAMEKKGLIFRKLKGREKIVSLRGK
jgi:uncharacterized membrane protein